MGQFILNFSKKIQKKRRDIQIVDSTQKQDTDVMQTQDGKRMTFPIPEKEPITIPTRS